jgi:hypothetical protein
MIITNQENIIYLRGFELFSQISRMAELGVVLLLQVTYLLKPK